MYNGGETRTVFRILVEETTGVTWLITLGVDVFVEAGGQNLPWVLEILFYEREKL
jgi:hypothetical protein